MSGSSPSTPTLLLSLLLLLLLVTLSLAGVLASDSLYPSRSLHLAFVPVDALNLVVVAPVLGAVLLYARRGQLLARLIWPGVLGVVLYTYVPYLVAVPMGPQFLGHLAIVVISAYALVGASAGLDRQAVAERLRGRIPARVIGGMLVLMGAGFLVRNTTVILAAAAEPSRVDLGVWIADGLLFPAFLGGGLLLLRDRAAGLAAATPILFVASVLFVGLVPVLAYPAFYDGGPIPWFDIVFVLTFGLVCFVPLGRCVRAVLASPSREHG